MESYIIRIYDQDLCIGWIDRGGYRTPKKYINTKQLFEDLKANGLEILKYTFSNLGACYFIEVKGEYKGKIEYSKLDTKPEDFSWAI